MSLFDVILLLIILGFGFAGLKFGLVYTLGSLLGSVLGIYLSIRYYEPVADWLIKVTGWGDNVLRIIVFAIAFILINRAVGLIFWFLGKTLQLVNRIPFIATFNRLFGFLFGIFEGGITIGFIFYFAAKFPVSETMTRLLATSIVVPYTIALAEVIIGFWPRGFDLLRSSVDFVEKKI